MKMKRKSSPQKKSYLKESLYLALISLIILIFVPSSSLAQEPSPYNLLNGSWSIICSGGQPLSSLFNCDGDDNHGSPNGSWRLPLDGAWKRTPNVQAEASEIAIAFSMNRGGMCEVAYVDAYLTWEETNSQTGASVIKTKTYTGMSNISDGWMRYNLEAIAVAYPWRITSAQIHFKNTSFDCPNIYIDNIDILGKRPELPTPTATVVVQMTPSSTPTSATVCNSTTPVPTACSTQNLYGQTKEWAYSESVNFTGHEVLLGEDILVTGSTYTGVYRIFDSSCATGVNLLFRAPDGSANYSTASAFLAAGWISTNKMWMKTNTSGRTCYTVSSYRILQYDQIVTTCSPVIPTVTTCVTSTPPPAPATTTATTTPITGTAAANASATALHGEIYGTATGTPNAPATGVAGTATSQSGSGDATATANSGNSGADATATAQRGNIEATRQAGATAVANAPGPPKECWGFFSDSSKNYTNYNWTCENILSGNPTCFYWRDAEVDDANCQLDYKTFGAVRCPVGYVPPDNLCFSNGGGGTGPIATGTPQPAPNPIPGPSCSTLCSFDSYRSSVEDMWFPFNYIGRYMVEGFCLIETILTYINETLGCIPGIIGAWAAYMVLESKNYLSYSVLLGTIYIENFMWNPINYLSEFFYYFNADLMAMMRGGVALVAIGIVATEAQLSQGLAAVISILMGGQNTALALAAEAKASAMVIEGVVVTTTTATTTSSLAAAAASAGLSPLGLALVLGFGFMAMIVAQLLFVFSLKAIEYMIAVSFVWAIDFAFYAAELLIAIGTAGINSLLNLLRAILNMLRWIYRIYQMINWLLPQIADFFIPAIQRIIDIMIEIGNITIELGRELIWLIINLINEMIAMLMELYSLMIAMFQFLYAQLGTWLNIALPLLRGFFEIQLPALLRSLQTWLEFFATYPLTLPLPWLTQFIEILGQWLRIPFELPLLLWPIIWPMVSYPWAMLTMFWYGFQIGLQAQAYDLIPKCTVHPDPWCGFYAGIDALDQITSQTIFMPLFLIGLLFTTLWVAWKNMTELWEALSK